MSPQIPIQLSAIREFCERWKIVEFSLFGSVLRDDFRPDSDIDVLIEFGPQIPWSLEDWVCMQEELGSLLGRSADLVEKGGLKNPFRRRAILSSRQVLYAA